MSTPAGWQEWLVAGLALGVLGAGVVVVGGVGEHGAGELALRAAGAFILGMIVGAAWWALTWLRAHSFRWPPETG